MTNLTRRQFLKRTIAGGTAITGCVIIPRSLRKAYAQKAKLNVAWLSSWIPGMDDVWDTIFNDWAKKNNVEVNVNRVARQCRDFLAVASADEMSTSLTAMSAPSLAKSKAIARPIPLPAPVTSATFPSSFMASPFLMLNSLGRIFLLTT